MFVSGFLLVLLFLLLVSSTPQVIFNLDQFPDLIHFTVTQTVILAQQKEQQELAERVVAAHSSPRKRRKTP